MKKLSSLILLLLLASHIIYAQEINCENALSFLDKQALAIAEINMRDPEFIPLHHLFLKDVQKELDYFNTNFIPRLTHCTSLNYYNVVSYYDQVAYLCKLKTDSMSMVCDKVDSLFYAQALFQAKLNNSDEAIYQVGRALQYNRTYPEALLLQCELMFEKNEYEECLDILHILFYEAEISENIENQIIRFTIRFYEKLYETADSLAKADLASDALYLFEILEKFCGNMPTTYCNDDYYHGILRSKRGIYDSYLLIATIAKQRGNSEIAEKFLEYAEQYRLENKTDLDNSTNARELPAESHLQILDNEIYDFTFTAEKDTKEDDINLPIIQPVIEESQNRISFIDNQSSERESESDTQNINNNEPPSREDNQELTLQNIEIEKFSNDNTIGEELFENSSNYSVEKDAELGNMRNVDSEESALEESALEESASNEIYSPEVIKQMEVEYNRLFLDAVSQCLDNKFSTALKTLEQALELEKCECFEKAPRVRILFETINEKR
ncbi:hypothetical protein LJC68_03300 [Bacteroidales bacterium OttesenSCG-928-B11]|nr:hypothetical protein [Bacteroidales bacterium OttesenSCG-928-C03]MDL2311886.1 hypothetical protein [Bacteroidales bacterium OttesenSCG-928-B11]MDL2326157.1 hypothetical protein [Bacteroidales bacterium OttesenSCG-928-A14]